MPLPAVEECRCNYVSPNECILYRIMTDYTQHWHLVWLLSKKGPMTAAELAKQTKRSLSNVWKDLKELQKINLVHNTRKGKNVIWSTQLKITMKPTNGGFTIIFQNCPYKE